jgi:hypothetical protein
MGKRLKLTARAAVCASLMTLAAYNDHAMQSTTAPPAPVQDSPSGYVTLMTPKTYIVSADASTALISVTVDGSLAGTQIAASYATINGRAAGGVDYAPQLPRALRATGLSQSFSRLGQHVP